jgi:hypothetical protein
VQNSLGSARLCCCAAGALALLVDINTLAQLVSIGTLFVFFMVSAAVLQVRACSAFAVFCVFTRVCRSR